VRLLAAEPEFETNGRFISVDAGIGMTCRQIEVPKPAGWNQGVSLHTHVTWKVTCPQTPEWAQLNISIDLVAG
jgi:hypothetical protein